MVSVNQMIGIMMGSIAVFGIIYYIVPCCQRGKVDDNCYKNSDLVALQWIHGNSVTGQVTIIKVIKR